MYRDLALRDDRSAVKGSVNKVHSAATPFNARLQSLTLRVQTRKGRQEAGVNVKDPSAVAIEKLLRKQSHIARKAHQIDLSFLQRLDDFSIVFLTRATP